MNRSLTAATAAYALFAAAACAKSKGASDGTAAAAAATSTTDRSPPAKADVDFMQGMIGHHAQAIRMAAMAPTHGANAKVLLLCKKIDNSQRDEIASMTHWLEDHHQTVPDTSKPMPMLMPGMLSADQMKQLDAAHDTTFDRLFLTFMIQHHQGALQMVKQLFATNGAAQQPDVFQYATDVNIDQSGEIDRMQQLLNLSPSSTSSPSGSSQHE